MTTVNIIVSIPGPWIALLDLEQALRAVRPEYNLHEGQLIQAARNEHFHLELAEYDPQVIQAFGIANRQSLSGDELDRVRLHKSCVYLIGPGGSLAGARAMMHAAGAVLDAGGLAVKVETAGIAHSVRDWRLQTSRCDSHVGALYIAYVALVAGHAELFSCGMHNIGLRDVIVAADPLAPQASEILRDFLMASIHEVLPLVNGETVVKDTHDGIAYQVIQLPCRTFASDDPFFNPFGMWRLVQLP